MKILIAFDGSDHSQAAISDLARAGLPADSEAVVMTVADVPSGVLGEEPPAGAADKLLVRVRADAKRSLEEAERVVAEGEQQVSALFPGWKVERLAVADSPYWAFVTRAGDIG